MPEIIHAELSAMARGPARTERAREATTTVPGGNTARGGDDTGRQHRCQLECSQRGSPDGSLNGNKNELRRGVCQIQMHIVGESSQLFR